MLIGASMGAEDIATYSQMLAGNHVIRIFPVSFGSSTTLKVLPSWTDSRFTYCQNNGVIPFVSTKCDGDTAALAHVKTQLQNMPAWITTLYITDRHEPEGDMSAATFQSNFAAFLAMVNSLPSGTRAKIKCGPILTSTWTEKAGTSREYSEYDPGTGDFFGVDMYVASGSSSSVVSPSTLITPANFVAKFKAYKKSATDTRPRWMPELGLIGMPDDLDGSARANWLQGIYNEVKLMRAGQPGWTQPWSFAGFIWWHQKGKATGEVYSIGQARDFPLHLRSVPEPDKTWVETKSDGTKVTHWISHPETLPGSPPRPVAAFNSIWLTENSGGAPQPQTVPILTVTGQNLAQKLTITGGTAPATTGNYLIGATMKKEEIAAWEPRLASNKFMRIFPNGTTKRPPDWSDARFAYCQRAGAVPFVSSNLDGDAAGFPLLRQWLIDMPAWVTAIYITDRHEPENNFSDPAVYKANFTLWWSEVIEKLPAATRAKVRAGHVLSRQWVEDASKGNGNYGVYDTGLGDFFGSDHYMNSWGSPSTTVATSYVDPVAFLQTFKNYRYKAPGQTVSTDTRDRVFPELGAIGLPADSTGAQRAAWIRGITAELDTWTLAAQGWRFVGWIWWNNQGTTSTTSLTGNPGIGTLRYFYLDSYQNAVDQPPVLYADPLPLKAYNEVALSHQSTGGGTGGINTSPDPEPDPGTTPNPDPTPNPGDYAGLPTDLIGSARLMASEFTLLITDRFLNVLGDPIVNWTTLDVTLRFNEPGSGQFTAPGYPWIREQLVPGCRVVCIRRVLGTASVLLAGPLESAMYERSDDGENGGDGKLTVTWADDLAWIAGRLTYPNPALAPSAQTTDNWLWDGNAELGMRALVEGNAGPSALAARRVPRLLLGTLNNVGANVKVTDARFVACTETLRDMARRGGGLGFRTIQSMSGKQIMFEVFQPRNLTNQVRFGFGIGNLKYVGYEVTAPELTTTIVGGQGTGADRFVIERNNATAETQWGRLESLVSRPGNDPLIELQEAGDEELQDGGEAVRLTTNAADTVDQRYGVHYGIGDRVSIEVWPGFAVSDLVQVVHLQAWPTAGEVVSTTVGSQATSYDSAFIKRLRYIDRRVGRLERNVLPF